MRIAMLTAGYPPTLGGVERHVERLANALSRAGHAVDVLSEDARQVGERHGGLREGGVSVQRFSALGPQKYAVSPTALREIGRRGAPRWDIVHLHSYHRVATGLAPFLSRVPVVVTTHYHGEGHTRPARVLHRAYRPLGAAALARAAAVIAVSESERGLLMRDFPHLAHRIFVVPNGVDAVSGATTAHARESELRILVTGRLEPYKQVDRVLAAAAHLADEVQLVICGDGPDRRRLEHLAAELRLGQRALFLGRVPDDELALRLAHAAALVSLSKHEAFGLAPAEALAVGVRVICSDIPAHRELAGYVPPSAMTLVPVDEHPARVADLVRAALDAGRFNAADVALLDWDDVAARVADVYASVLQQFSRA